MGNRFKIGICHQRLQAGDAIGNDICSMYDLLTAMDFDVTIVGEIFDEFTKTHKKTWVDLNTSEINRFELLIYHHSIYWEKGESLLSNFHGELILRYHNVTPWYFFETYSLSYTELCKKGAKQTQRLARSFSNNYWLADSTFNRDELVDFGADPKKVVVVPPFNRVQDYLWTPRRNNEDRVIKVCFVGRFAPNKRHQDLVRIVDAYVNYLSKNITLQLVGMQDPNLSSYIQEVEDLISKLKVGDHVKILSHISEQELKGIFHSSDVFLCTSQHEGFCVPIIEAQAAGLPVVSVNSTALKETIGPQQLVADPPQTSQDYVFYARLIQEVCTNLILRQVVTDQGYRNVLQRFVPEVIENQFITELLPVFQRLL